MNVKLKRKLASLLSLCCISSVAVSATENPMGKSETQVMNSASRAYELATATDILGAPVFSVPARKIFVENDNVDSKYRGAFCMERTKPSPTGQTYTREGILDDAGLYTIVKNGYPYNAWQDVTGAANETEAMYITQLSIWSYLEGWDNSKVKAISTAMTTAFRNLVDRARNNPIDNVISVDVNKKTLVAEQKGDKMVAGPYTLNTKGITKGTYNVFIENNDVDAFVIDENGAPKTRFDKDESFYISIPVGASSGSLNVSIDTDFKKEVIVKYLSPDDTIQDVLSLREEAHYVSVPTSVSWSQPIGSLELTKKDVATGDLLPNAKFVIRDRDGNRVTEGVTDDLGIAKFSLGVGKYTYQEFDAPEGYVIDESEFPFEITSDGQIVKAEMTNKKISGELELTKKDVATGDLLPNAKFRIKNINGEIVSEGSTDENGLAKFTLEYGKYTYQEYDAPEGYIIDESEFPFEIKTNGEIVKAEMTNKKIASTVKIIKTDSKTGALLENAEFTLYDIDGNIVDTVRTDINGEAIIEDILYGVYTLQETDSPDGYYMSEEVISIEVINDGDIIEVRMKNIPMEAVAPIIPTEEPLPETGGFNISNILLSLCGVAGGLVMMYKDKKSKKEN